MPSRFGATSLTPPEKPGDTPACLKRPRIPAGVHLALLTLCALHLSWTGLPATLHFVLVPGDMQPFQKKLRPFLLTTVARRIWELSFLWTSGLPWSSKDRSFAMPKSRQTVHRELCDTESAGGGEGHAKALSFWWSFGKDVSCLCYSWESDVWNESRMVYQ